MNLSDEEKNRIRSEEFYRKIIQNEIDKENSKSGFDKVLFWLNKPLGIWFLSAVLIGGISEGFKYFQTKQDQLRSELQIEEERIRTKRELVDKLDGEIALRLNRVRDQVLSFSRDKITTLNLENAGLIVHYPEFRDRSLTSLMFELQSALQDLDKNNESLEVQKALHNWFKIQNWESYKGSIEGNGGTFSKRSFFLPLIGRIFVDRWKDDIDNIIEFPNATSINQ
jgi:hypothetical protein